MQAWSMSNNLNSQLLHMCKEFGPASCTRANSIARQHGSKASSFTQGCRWSLCDASSKLHLPACRPLGETRHSRAPSLKAQTVRVLTAL